MRYTGGLVKTPHQQTVTLLTELAEGIAESMEGDDGLKCSV